MKVRKDWYRRMFDSFVGNFMLNLPSMHKAAEKEVKFIVKKFKLPKEAQFLDVPCGVGRHSRILCKKGYKVTGLDISRYCIRQARKNCRSKNARFVLGDIAKLAKYRHKFDALINMYTSIGYYPDDKKNRSVMRGLVSCLRPGGRIAFSLVNRDWLKKHFKANEWFDLGDYYLLENRKLDRDKKYITSNWTVIAKKSKRIGKYAFRLRVYGSSEMISMLRNFGFEDVKAYGGFDGSKFSRHETRHAVYIAKKR